MQMIIAIVLNAVLVGAGIFGGAMLSAPKTNDTVIAAAAETPEVPSEEGEGTAENGTGLKDPYSLRFNRPFVIPVNDGWKTTALVVINLSVELERDMAEGMTALENKCRDRIMAALMSYSHEGHLTGPVTDPAVYDGLRTSVREALTPVFEDGVGDVLLLEVVKRSV